MDRIAMTVGFLPRTDRAADAPVTADERRDAIERQRDAGLDRIAEGQLAWRDLLAHPLATHDRVETRDPVPSFGTGATYREPVVVDELTFTGAMARDLSAASTFTDRLQAVVPGPYTLASLATNEHYRDDDEFLAAVTEFLVAEVEAFPAVETLSVLEPALVHRPPPDGADARASDAVDAVAGASDADVVVHASGGALTEKVHAHLMDADVAAIGYDFVTEVEANLSNINEYGTKGDLALGVVDAGSEDVETPALVAERVEWVLENTPPVVEFDRVYATPNDGLRHLPADVAWPKVAALGEGVDADE